jgi:hypothetical protein
MAYRFCMPAPTIDEVIDTLLDNADFESAQSVSKAASFVTAATQYFILTPQSQSDQGSSMAISATQIENLLNRARAFVSANRTNSGSAVRFLSVSGGFR